MRIGAIMCSRRHRRCSRHEIVKIHVFYVAALRIRPVWRSVFLHYNIFFRSGGQTFAGMRMRSCGAVLFRATFAAQKLDLAAGRGCACGRWTLYAARSADRECFRACLCRYPAIFGGNSGYTGDPVDRRSRRGRNTDFHSDCGALCASLQLDSHAQRRSCLSARFDGAGSGTVPDHFADASGGLGHPARCGHSCTASFNAAAPCAAGR